MQKAMIIRAKQLLADNTVNRVLGWKNGDFVYDVTPSVFHTANELDCGFVYNAFCGANLSKYLVKESEKPGKILVFLKPCDSYSMNQLLSEHKIKRENIRICGISCSGMTDAEMLRKSGITGITEIIESGDMLKISTLYGDSTVTKTDVQLEKCRNCKSRKHVIYDELIGEDGEVPDSKRFDEVEKIENMSSDERFEYWRGELSRCIRCNACRNVCPACTCEKCIFDNPSSDFENKAASDMFEENLFHIIRAFHVAGRCTDCGECSRVCPEHIPLHLLNRKLIKDINGLYGNYQAGAEINVRNPLVSYTKEDVEISVIGKRRGK